MEARAFNVGYMRFNQEVEEIFLSVTPGFERGPGIQRDGISAPRMTDPHCVAYVMNARGLRKRDPVRHTVNPYHQRAGTWTLFKHLKNFDETLGKDGWTIIGAQGHGDLTMNYWHVAYCNQHGLNSKPIFCRLETVEDRHALEPYQERTYRCLVKWREAARTPRVEFANVTFQAAQSPAGVTLHLPDDQDREITGEVSLAMAGKTIIENRIELPLETIIDKFDDVRHVFVLPETPARGYLRGNDINAAILAEYNLYTYLNERRAALHCPVVIQLEPKSSLTFEWAKVQNTLVKNHFRPTRHSSDIPTLRGQFRKYPGQLGASESVEVFFPRNVYPFSVVGMRSGAESDGTSPSEVICLSSGGLSGRIGNTLEGITRIAYDFLACGEAMVVDEGLDVFQLVNPPSPSGLHTYTNEQIVSSVADYTVKLQEQEEAKWNQRFPGTAQPHELPLNEENFLEPRQMQRKTPGPPIQDIFPVIPQRSQIRAVLIFAKKESPQRELNISQCHE